MKRLLLLVAALGCSATLAGAATARPTYVSFITPSGNIGCGYSSGLGPRLLRCDIQSRLEPQPRRPAGCKDLNWGDSYTMRVTGLVEITCHGDTAIIKGSKVLAYGKTWSRGGFECWSRAVGLRCVNHSGHGFFLSRRHSYRF